MCIREIFRMSYVSHWSCVLNGHSVPMRIYPLTNIFESGLYLYFFPFGHLQKSPRMTQHDPSELGSNRFNRYLYWIRHLQKRALIIFNPSTSIEKVGSTKVYQSMIAGNYNRLSLFFLPFLLLSSALFISLGHK